jgi:hypothetical protein
LCDNTVRAGYVSRGVEFATQFSSTHVGAQLVALCEQVAGRGSKAIADS